MATPTSIIETGVDRLVNLVKRRGKIALQDAAKELGVSLDVIEEWADFLEEEGMISIEYKLTKPYLVERELTEKELEKKVKEFHGKKDVFVRKAEISMGFLNKEATRLKSVKKEFDSLKKELGIEVEGVKDELKELEKYEQMKKDLDVKLLEQRKNSKEKIDDMDQQIAREKKKYQSIIQEISKEEEELGKDIKDAKTIEGSEEKLKKKLTDLRKFIEKLEEKLTVDDVKLRNSEKHIEKLKELADEIKNNVETEKKQLNDLIKENVEQENKMVQLQSEVLSKIKQEEKKMSKTSDLSKKFKMFFKEKMRIFELINKVNKDRDDMEKSLSELIKKARTMSISPKKGKDISKQIKELEKKFVEVDKRKGLFESELKKLNSIIKFS